MGWDYAKSFNHGPYPNEDVDTKPQFITYTDIYCPASKSKNEKICDDDLKECDICVNCLLTYDFDNQCSKTKTIAELHSLYDIYVSCSNEDNENNPNSNMYNCTYYDTSKVNVYNDSEWHLDEFGSCHDAYINNDGGSTDHGNLWKFLVVIGILIASIICMIIYCRSTKRMKHRKFTDAYMENLGMTMSS